MKVGKIGKRTSAGFIVICAFVVLLRRKEKENFVLASIEESGYVGELHHTITEDGYILGLHRILKPNYVQENTGRVKRRSPVLFVHGLESSAVDWINYHGKESLPYLLLEKGYDVWLGNVRGTQVSLNHTSIDPNTNSKQFWNSSIHEIGCYDLPAMIDYVLEMSEAERIFYVGMSQGEATFLIMTSERPEYNAKIELASLTAPSSHLKHSDNVVLKSLGAVWPALEFAANAVGLYTVPGRDMFGSICQYPFFIGICEKIYDPFVGYADHNQSIHTSKLFQVYPVKSAFKQLLHYLQIYNSGIFRKFDYGKEGNLRHYGLEEPPEYDMSRITAPVAYFWGENDCWSRPKDVADIEKKLPNMVLSYKIPHKSFNHNGILVAKDAITLAYYKIIDTINTYNKKES